MPLITDVIAIAIDYSRRMGISGRCLRHNDEIAHNLTLWEPKFGRRNRGTQVFLHRKS